MKSLSLDLGTFAGYCIFDAAVLESGTLELATKAELVEQKKTGLERRLDLRYKALSTWIHTQVHTQSVQRIIFEDVTFNTSQFQAQLWASLRAGIWQAAIHCPTIEIQCIPVKTLKSFATGNGNADKILMKQALRLQHPNIYKEAADDNEVDAIWLALFTIEVDKGNQSWSSVWENKQKAKAEKQRKLALKREKAKEQLDVLIEELRGLLPTVKTPDLKRAAKEITKLKPKEFTLGNKVIFKKGKSWQISTT